MLVQGGKQGPFQPIGNGCKGKKGALHWVEQITAITACHEPPSRRTNQTAALLPPAPNFKLCTQICEAVRKLFSRWPLKTENMCRGLL